MRPGNTQQDSRPEISSRTAFRKDGSDSRKVTRSSSLGRRGQCPFSTLTSTACSGHRGDRPLLSKRNQQVTERLIELMVYSRLSPLSESCWLAHLLRLVLSHRRCFLLHLAFCLSFDRFFASSAPCAKDASSASNDLRKRGAAKSRKRRIFKGNRP